MEKREDLVLDLRDQQNCNHPCYAAQNLLTGAGKPIMSPSQQRQTSEDLRIISALRCQGKTSKSDFAFINDAFEADDQYQSGQL